jgi:hypothetical protein
MVPEPLHTGQIHSYLRPLHLGQVAVGWGGRWGGAGGWTGGWLVGGDDSRWAFAMASSTSRPNLRSPLAMRPTRDCAMWRPFLLAAEPSDLPTRGRAGTAAGRHGDRGVRPVLAESGGSGPEHALGPASRVAVARTVLVSPLPLRGRCDSEPIVGVALASRPERASRRCGGDERCPRGQECPRLSAQWATVRSRRQPTCR